MRMSRPRWIRSSTNTGRRSMIRSELRLSTPNLRATLSGKSVNTNRGTKSLAERYKK